MAAAAPTQDLQKSVWYKAYVLFILLLTCICNLSTRYLPSYLITVPVPDCEMVCNGVATRPLCGKNRVQAFPEGRPPTRVEACQLCRSRIVPVERQAGVRNGTELVEDANTTAGFGDGGLKVRNADSAQDSATRFGPHNFNSAHAGEPSMPWPKGKKPLSLAVSEVRQKQIHLATTDSEISIPSLLLDDPEYSEDITLDNVPWSSSEGLDAQFYNMGDGSCLYHWEYGILIGYGFAIIFAVGSIAAGVICDQRPRVSIAACAMMAWSVATALQAASHSFVFLLGCRAVIGLAQAFAMPAAISITADFFTDRQNVAVAVLSVGLYLGSGCASFSILIAEYLGWRWAVLVAGLVGMLLTPILYHTVQEPERTEWSAPCTIQVVADEVFEKSRVARMLIVAASCKMLAAYTLSAFLPIWYSRRGLAGYTNNSYAGWNALVISTGGLLSTLLGSVIGHRWSQRDACAPCWIGLLGSIFSLPLICMVLLTQSFAISMLCFFLLLLVSESWFGPTVALLQRSVRPSVRFQAVSMFLVASTLAANLGPALVGFLDPGGERIGLHIMWISLAANVCSGAAFFCTAREIMIDPVAASVRSAPRSGKGSGFGIEDGGNKAGTAHWAL